MQNHRAQKGIRFEGKRYNGFLGLTERAYAAIFLFI